MPKLNKEFYERSNVLLISRELLGKVLCTNYNGKLTSGIIVETEAYAGVIDKASHAYNNIKTKRTEVMYKTGGCCYVYLCYGIHYLFNIVTNQVNIPHAVLIRSGEPHSGIDSIKKRRGNNIQYPNLLKGPGNFTKGMGIAMNLNGAQLNSKYIWIEDNFIEDYSIESTQRVGIDYAGEDALLPWRYILKNFR